VPALPPSLAWVGDWRLRSALSSPTRGEQLLLVLSQLVASCWALAGRRRTACLLYADMALVLLRTPNGAPAAQASCFACLHMRACVRMRTSLLTDEPPSD
jgi:hypothetical protein